MQESVADLLLLQDAICTCFNMSFPGDDHLADEAPDDLEEEMMQQAIAMSLQVSSPTQQYVSSLSFSMLALGHPWALQQIINPQEPARDACTLDVQYGQPGAASAPAPGEGVSAALLAGLQAGAGAPPAQASAAAGSAATAPGASLMQGPSAAALASLLAATSAPQQAQAAGGHASAVSSTAYPAQGSGTNPAQAPNWAALADMLATAAAPQAGGGNPAQGGSLPHNLNPAALAGLLGSLGGGNQQLVRVQP